MGGVPSLSYLEGGGNQDDGRADGTDSTPLHDSSQEQPNYHTYVS